MRVRPLLLSAAAVATAGYSGFLVGPPLIGSLAEAATLRWALGLLGLIGVLVVVYGGATARCCSG